MKDQSINALSSELSSTVMKIREGFESNASTGKIDMSPLRKEGDNLFAIIAQISKIAADDNRSVEIKNVSNELKNTIDEIESLQKFVMQGIRKMWNIN
ncbi:hypothetical protein GUI12_03280 [Anaplasmataceae bacterium AB001_6]|nr:hypothetical protein GUI12_03280 [Anaplasmataceae bacterium AB001_6]